MENHKHNRTFMKSSLDDTDIVATADIAKGIPQPPIEKPYPPDAYTISLPEVNRATAPQVDFFECVARRRSRRGYSGEEGARTMCWRVVSQSSSLSPGARAILLSIQYVVLWYLAPQYLVSKGVVPEWGRKPAEYAPCPRRYTLGSKRGSWPKRQTAWPHLRL